MASNAQHLDGVPGSINDEIGGDKTAFGLDDEAAAKELEDKLANLNDRQEEALDSSGEYFDPGTMSGTSNNFPTLDKPGTFTGLQQPKQRFSLLQVTSRENLEDQQDSNSRDSSNGGSFIGSGPASLRVSTNSRNSMTSMNSSGGPCMQKTKSERQRRGAARRESGQHGFGQTVETKRASGFRARPRFQSILHTHTESHTETKPAEPHSAFRDSMKSELSALGGRLWAEHEAIVSLLTQRCEWFEHEHGLMTWELDRMCMEQGMPKPIHNTCPHRLSIQHLKPTAALPTAPRKSKSKKNSTQLAGMSYKDLLKRQSWARSSIESRSSLVSEIYQDASDSDAAADDKRSSVVAPAPAEEVRSTEVVEDKPKTEDLWKVAPPPPQEHHPPPPIIEQDSKEKAPEDESTTGGSTNAVEPLRKVEPPMVTLNTQQIISVMPPPVAISSNQRGSVGSDSLPDADPVWGRQDSKTSLGSTLGVPGAESGRFAPYLSVTVNPPIQPVQLLIPGGEKIGSARVSWMDGHTFSAGFNDDELNSRMQSMQDVEAFSLCKVWADKVNRMRPSRGSQRSRGSERRGSNTNLMHSNISRSDEEAVDSDSDEDQRLIDRCNVRTSIIPGGSTRQDSQVLGERQLLFERLTARRGHIRMRKLVIEPESRVRTFFDLLGAILVAYESVAIPLQFFVRQSIVLTVMEWFIRIFWTIELFLSMLTSFIRPNGKLERRPKRVVQRYLKTWFPFDLLMVLLDWSELVLLDYDGLIVLGRIVKSIRLVRTVRLLRFAKLHRLPDFVKSVAFYFRSDMCLIVLSILRLIIFVIWINHVVCCCWYEIGSQSGGKNWISYLDLEDKELMYQYWTSFHWSLAQFAAGSVEVIPCNLFERVYAVAALLFAYICSAWIISSITSSMTRLEIAAAQESQKMMTLKQYLYDNNISRQVAMRIQRNAQFALAEKTRKRDESAIELLSLISEPLRMDMHFEINSKWLCFHPLFRNYCVVSPGLMRQVCHQALSRLDLSKGDMLFTDDEPCVQPSMYFILNGKMSFLHGLGTQPRGVSVGHWACEATLWTEWVHCGDMRAVADTSTLLVLDSIAFQAIVSSSENQWMPCYKYGMLFTRHLCFTDEEKLTDLCDPDMDLESWVSEACPDAQEIKTPSLGLKSLRRSSAPKPLSSFLQKGGSQEDQVVPGLLRQSSS